MGKINRVYVIAEFGSNPVIGGRADEVTLDRYVRAAALAGANAVKVQLFAPEDFPEHERAKKAGRVFPQDGTLRWLVNLSREYGLGCGASVFNPDAVRHAGDSGVSFLKMGTRSQYDYNLLNQMRGTTTVPILRSVRWDPRAAYTRYSGTRWTLGCVDRYPADGTFNLLPLLTLRSHGVDGWSSHTTGITDVVLAVLGGAVVVEKHLSLSPLDVERGWSLDPNWFRQMTRWIKVASTLSSYFNQP